MVKRTTVTPHLIGLVMRESDIGPPVRPSPWPPQTGDDALELDLVGKEPWCAQCGCRIVRYGTDWRCAGEEYHQCTMAGCVPRRKAESGG